MSPLKPLFSETSFSKIKNKNYLGGGGTLKWDMYIQVHI